MILKYEHRMQIFYFLRSGLVASALLLLIYITMQTTMNNQRKGDLKQLQKSLRFIRPAISWNYSNAWQPVEAKSRKHQIFSAYFDFRTDVFDHVNEDTETFLYGSIRIFAILPVHLNEVITCVVREQDFTTSKIEALEASPMQEHQDEAFAVWSIMCPLRVRRNTSTVMLPIAVALSYASVTHKRSKATYVKISYPKNFESMLQKSKPAMAMCVGLLQEDNANAIDLVEFIEIYRILGATHFYFYRIEASKEVNQVLNYYRNIGLTTIFEWNIGYYGNDMHEVGSSAQINDCIYRAMVVENYRYAIVVDPDEILIPLKHNSLADYLRQTDEGRTSAFVFRNVFFYKRDGNDMFTVPPHVKNRYLFTQNKVRRGVEVMPAHARTKCIVNTRAIIEMGHHRVLRELPGFTETVMQPTVGLKFHYREKCLNCRAMLVNDYTARKYGSLMWNQVDEVCQQIFKRNSGLCPAA